MINGGRGFTINGGAFNNVHGAQYNNSGNTNNHIAGDMNSYHTENHGNNNVTNNGANYAARPRRGQRRPPPAPRYDYGYEDEAEYYPNRPRMPYYPASDPSYGHQPPPSMGYGGYGPEPPYQRREHYDPNNAYETRHGPPRQYGPAPQRDAYPDNYDPRYNPQHQSYRDDRQQPPPRDPYDHRGYARPQQPPPHHDQYYDPQSPDPQYYPQNSPPSGPSRPAPPPHTSSAPAEMEQGLPSQHPPQPPRSHTSTSESRPLKNPSYKQAAGPVADQEVYEDEDGDDAEGSTRTGDGADAGGSGTGGPMVRRSGPR